MGFFFLHRGNASRPRAAPGSSVPCPLSKWPPASWRLGYPPPQAARAVFPQKGCRGLAARVSTAGTVIRRSGCAFQVSAAPGTHHFCPSHTECGGGGDASLTNFLEEEFYLLHFVSYAAWEHGEPQIYIYLCICIRLFHFAMVASFSPPPPLIPPRRARVTAHPPWYQEGQGYDSGSASATEQQPEEVEGPQSFCGGKPATNPPPPFSRIFPEK